MIDLQHMMKKFPSYARKVRISQLVVASRRRRRAFNINRAVDCVLRSPCRLTRRYNESEKRECRHDRRELFVKKELFWTVTS